ncbi:unnamed protein product [Mucor hiemalis]
MAVELKIIYHYYAGINGSFANKPSQPLTFSSSSSTTLKSRHQPSKRTSILHSSSSRSSRSHSIRTTATYISTSSAQTHYSSSTQPIASTLPSQQKSQNANLSSGTIVGITFSIICAIALVIFIYFFYVIRKARNRKYPTKRQSYLDVVVGQNDCPSSAIITPRTPSSYNHTVIDNEKIYIDTTPSSLTTSTKETYIVTSSYTQTLDDELFIQPGDKVQIFNEYDDGWCLGKNLTRGGARGVLPQNCLDKK